MDSAIPEEQGLYDPANEHDACGVGFVAHIRGKKSYSIIEQGLLILKNLDHRGAVLSLIHILMLLIALVTLISGVCKAGLTFQTTM